MTEDTTFFQPPLHAWHYVEAKLCLCHFIDGGLVKSALGLPSWTKARLIETRIFCIFPALEKIEKQRTDFCAREKKLKTEIHSLRIQVKKLGREKLEMKEELRTLEKVCGSSFCHFVLACILLVIAISVSSYVYKSNENLKNTSVLSAQKPHSCGIHRRITSYQLEIIAKGALEKYVGLEVAFGLYLYCVWRV